MLVTTQGLINRIISKNEAVRWCGWGSIPTRYTFFSLEGGLLRNQKTLIQENTRNDGVLLEEVPLNEALLLEELKEAQPGDRLYYHRDDSPRTEGDEIAIRTKDGWKVHRYYLGYWK